MRRMHMIVHLVPTRERRHAHPADMRLAPRTRHMVTPGTPLDGGLTARTLLDVVSLRPLLEQLHVLALRVPAYAFMVLPMAVCANAYETGRASKDGALRLSGAVDLRTVWCGAMVEVGGAGMDVGEEGGLEDRVDLRGGEDLAGDAKGDAVRAASFVAKAFEGEHSGVDRGEEIVCEA